MTKQKQEELSMKDSQLGKDIKKPINVKKSKFQRDLENWSDEARVISKNAFDFIETLSLLIVTAFAIYGSLTYELRNEYKYAVLFSGVVVGLIAMNLLRKFLARR